MRDIEDYTQKYLKAGFEDYQVKYRRKKVLEILRNHRPKKVLEIGCGMKPLFAYADWDYDLWTLVEPSDSFYENAKKAACKMQKNILIYHDFFPTSSIRNSNFDFVICSGLLHEVEKPNELLKGITRICTEKTIIHINVPNANSFHRVLAKAMGVIDDLHDFSSRNKQLQQHRVFDLDSLKKEVKDAGFIVVDCGSYFIKPFTHDQMYKMVETDIIGEDVLDGLYVLSDELKEYGSEIYINAKLSY